MIKGMEETGMVDIPLLTSFKNTSNKVVDNSVYNSIKKALVDNFGPCAWSIKFDHLLVPIINKGARRTEMKFIIKNISWKNGPSIHEVHYFVIEHFAYYMPTTQFNPKLYTRILQSIEKRYVYKFLSNKDLKTPLEINIKEKRKPGEATVFTVRMNDPRVISSFVPLPINNKYFAPISVFISKIRHKINDKEMTQHFQLTVNEPRYLINTITGNSMNHIFSQLQDNLESIFYQRENTPDSREANSYLMKTIVTASEEAGGGSPQPLVRDKDGDSAQEEAMEEAKEDPAEEANETPEEEAREEAAEEGGSIEHADEGQGLSGTDQPDTASDASIPQEESIEMGGTPPTQEMIDHNFNNDANPELVKDWIDESGGPDVEEAGEDPAEEATETPEQEAEEETAEESQEMSLGYTIDDLMSRDKIVESLIKT